MCANSQSDLACFAKGSQVAVDELHQRLCPKSGKLKKGDCEMIVNELI